MIKCLPKTIIVLKQFKYNFKLIKLLPTMDSNKKKMEVEGMKKVEELKKANNVTQESVLKIVSDGFDQFEKENGRPMTYS
jgi:hypothetical protein